MTRYVCYVCLLQVLEADVPAASSQTVKAWRSEQHAHESETEALLSMMQHHAVNLGVSMTLFQLQAWTAPKPQHTQQLIG